MSASTMNETIAIVDDTPATLMALDDLLTSRGYQVRSFSSGALALAAAAQDPPGLFLLDVGMPEMSGYEVCERLKADPVLAPIPVIFVSGLHETQDKMRAFSSGGVDYVTKPFQVQEVVARVETHLTLRRLQRTLELHNAQLEQTVRIRTRELEEANTRLLRLDEAKSHFLRLIAHELRIPLTGLFGAGELLVAACPPDPRTQKLGSVFTRARDRLLKVIDDALLLTEIEVGKVSSAPGSVALGEVLEVAINGARKFADPRNVAIGAMPAGECLIAGDRALYVRAIQALLETAVRFCRAGETVWMASELDSTEAVLRIEARGLSIPEVELPRFFQILATAGTIVPGGDLGLDPAIAQQILSLYGGRAAVENLDPPGIRLSAHLGVCATATPV